MFHPDGPTLAELTRQALSSTDRGYDLLAPKFDRTPFRTPDEVLAPVARFLAGGAPFEDAVDLCCGTGAGIAMLRPLARRVTGIDRSEGMLAEARRRLGDDADIHLVRDDVLQPSLDRGFDIATCFGAFGHILPDDQPRLVASVRRLLRPGGRFVFVTAPLPSPREPRWWLARGFNLVMHVRNALLRPPFVMFYLLFHLDEARRLLEEGGFRVEVHPLDAPPPFDRLVIVEATAQPSPASAASPSR